MCEFKEFSKRAAASHSPTVGAVDMLKSTEQHPTAAMQPITSWIQGYSKRQQFRRMAQTLLKEKDDTLSDLGYDRHDLEGALHLPIRNDAMQFIEARRSRRALEARRAKGHRLAG